MAHYVVMIKSSAKSGQEQAYEDWYNSTHLAEVLAVEGFRSGRQFRLPPGSSHTHAAIFELETDDPVQAMARLGEVFRSGSMTPTKALDTAVTPESVVLTPTAT